MSKIYIGTTEKRGACIIGAGLSGLIAIKHLKAHGMEVMAVEAKSDIGGTWNKSQNREISQQGLKELYGNYLPEIYENLDTNVHHVFMTFRDMPLKDCTSTTIVTSAEFNKHIHEYADKFDLRGHILFEKLVSKIRLTANLSSDQIKHYELNKTDLSYKYTIFLREAVSCGDKRQEETIVFCNYVVCCNGTYASPNVPSLKGRELYTGQEMHTSDYTDMQSFRAKLENKRVVVVGSGISGRDIVNHIVMGFKGEEPIKVASLTMVMSSDAEVETFRKAQSNYKKHSEMLKTAIGPVVAFSGPNTLRTKYGTVNADVIVWATGYKQSLPFIDPADDIVHIEQEESRGNYLYPLFMKTFSINQPTFAKPCDPFVSSGEVIPTLERQLSMIAAVFSGKTQLPSKQEMLASLEKSIAKIRESGLTLKTYCKETMGVNDQKMLFDEWFSYSGHERRNEELERFSQEVDKAETYYLSNGYYFAPLQLSLAKLSYNGDYSSSSF